MTLCTYLVHNVRVVAVTQEEIRTFERCIAVGGVALFPADTVYGLATDPASAEGVRRLYALKGRRADRPAAVMFFRLELALAALPELPRVTREALVSGADGLDAIRALVAQAPSGIRVALEHAPAQTEAVKGLLRSPRVYPDLAGLPRVTVGFSRD